MQQVNALPQSSPNVLQSHGLVPLHAVPVALQQLPRKPTQVSAALQQSAVAAQRFAAVAQQ
jgi:hypothetical protein